MIFPYLQYILPQHALSQLAGMLGNSTNSQLKSFLIKQFIRYFKVDLSEAIIQDPTQFKTFNDFFTRSLRQDTRPIASDRSAIVSPCDGTISVIGQIKKQQLLQAKNQYFDLLTLLGGDQQLANQFEGGAFTTLYLAPANYHRVHMPLAGKLEKSIYVPGKLFSVNRMTSEMIPSLYARNERIIAIFNTDAGKMAVVMVGALIVGSIKMVWQSNPHRGAEIQIEQTHPTAFAKGDEIGYFEAGSTVIVLFEKDHISWQKELASQTELKMGECIGNIS